MSHSFDAKARGESLMLLAFCCCLFLPFIDRGFSITVERWQVQKICRAHHFDFAINASQNSRYPFWQCQVRGPTAADGKEQSYAVFLENADRYEVEAINFRRDGGPSHEGSDRR